MSLVPRNRQTLAEYNTSITLFQGWITGLRAGVRIRPFVPLEGRLRRRRGRGGGEPPPCANQVQGLVLHLVVQGLLPPTRDGGFLEPFDLNGVGANGRSPLLFLLHIFKEVGYNFLSNTRPLRNPTRCHSFGFAQDGV